MEGITRKECVDAVALYCASAIKDLGENNLDTMCAIGRARSLSGICGQIVTVIGARKCQTASEGTESVYYSEMLRHVFRIKYEDPEASISIADAKFTVRHCPRGYRLCLEDANEYLATPDDLPALPLALALVELAARVLMMHAADEITLPLPANSSEESTTTASPTEEV